MIDPIKVASFSAKNEIDLAGEMDEFFEENEQNEIQVISCQYEVSTYIEPGYGSQQWHFALLIYKIKVPLVRSKA